MRLSAAIRSIAVLTGLASVLSCASNKPQAVAGGLTSRVLAVTGYPMQFTSVNPNVTQLIWDDYKAAGNTQQYKDIAEHLEIGGYHDVQRLQVGQSGNYGPLVRAYAFPTLRDDQAFRQADGALVAILEVLGKSDSHATYRDLGIDKEGMGTGLFCVFLWLRYTTQSEGSASNQWEASVRPVVGAGCDSMKPSYKMNVARVVAGGTTLADYQPFVRFVDNKADKPLLAVPCGRAWCELGKSAGATKDPVDPAGSTQEKVKLWQDVQILSMNGSNGPPGRSDVEASITPITDLEKKPTDYFTPDVGGLVATIRASKLVSSGTKYAKWKLDRFTKVDVYIRNFGLVWGAQFVESGKQPVASDPWLEIIRVKHRPNTVPGIARWLWDENDESVWVSCDQGCCEVTDSPLTFISR